MSGALLTALTMLATIGCAMVGGVFFAFSAFVIKALARLPAPQGIAAMQSINEAAVAPPLMTAMFGSAAVCAVLGALALLGRLGAGALFALAGALAYLVGAVGVTIAGNVPRNNALAAVDAESEAGAVEWKRFVPRWTVWNSVRAIAALVAAGLFCLALVQRR